MAKKKASRRGGGTEELNITSMMDMMTIILVFLLKSYSTDDVSVKPSADLSIPVSTSVKTPKVAVNVIVEAKRILVDGLEVVNLEEYTTDEGTPSVRLKEDDVRGVGIPSLERVLEEAKDKQKEFLRSTGRTDADFKGEILLQAHKEVPYEVIRSVMYTAGQQEFAQFRFVVIKGSG